MQVDHSLHLGKFGSGHADTICHNRKFLLISSRLEISRHSLILNHLSLARSYVVLG